MRFQENLIWSQFLLCASKACSVLVGRAQMVARKPTEVNVQSNVQRNKGGSWLGVRRTVKNKKMIPCSWTELNCLDATSLKTVSLQEHERRWWPWLARGEHRGNTSSHIHQVLTR